MTAKFSTGTDLFGSWLAATQSGVRSPRFAVAEPFAGLDIRPGRLLLVGGAPGSGKTAALLQIGVELVRQNEELKLLVANVEMVPVLLVDRIVARMSGVPLAAITDRALDQGETERVAMAAEALGPVAGRLAFLEPPYSLEHVAAASTAFGANVLVLDYLQRFAVGGGTADKKDQLESGMAKLRQFCDAGAAVMVAAAVARQRSEQGATYQNLNLASFRGSSELEFGCDSAYMVVPGRDDVVNFQCEKNRYGAVVDIATQFDAARQTFKSPFGSPILPLPTPLRGRAVSAAQGA